MKMNVKLKSIKLMKYEFVKNIKKKETKYKKNDKMV
jgi:hypothetical protein